MKKRSRKYPEPSPPLDRSAIRAQKLSVSGGRLSSLLCSLALTFGCRASEDHATTVSRLGERWRCAKSEIEFIWVPAGQFAMGSTSDRSIAEPVFLAKIKRPFWIAKYEVTRRQFGRIMKISCKEADEDFPMTGISWSEANRFCQQLTEHWLSDALLPPGYVCRLPTEQEWEYACRAGATNDFAGQIDQVCWYFHNAASRPMPVGTKLPNAWGLFDMHGNVREWCLDACDPPWADLRIFGIKLSREPYRILRGGSAWDVASRCSAAYRASAHPENKLPYAGFRVLCAMKVKPPLVQSPVRQTGYKADGM